MKTRMSIDMEKCRRCCNEDWGGGCPIYQGLGRKLGEYGCTDDRTRVYSREPSTSRKEFGFTQVIGNREGGSVSVDTKRSDSSDEGVSRCRTEVVVSMPEDSTLHDDIPREFTEGYRKLREFAGHFA